MIESQYDENKIILDAVSLQKSGVSAIVVEGVKSNIVSKIKMEVNTTLIGIGASIECDGQILVLDDLLGLNENPAKFVKTYANFKQSQKYISGIYSSDKNSKEFRKFI